MIHAVCVYFLSNVFSGSLLWSFLFSKYSPRHKLSALEIERTLLEHPHVAEWVIVGIDDETWGQRVGAICRMKPHCSDDILSLEELREWCTPRMAKERIPSRLLVVKEIPKNAMGKVNKKTLVQLFDA